MLSKIVLVLCFLVALASSQTPTGTFTTPPSVSASVTSTYPTGSPTSNTTTSARPTRTPTSNSTVPDVVLKVPELHVGKIELDVDNLRADINLNANVAKIVSINAGVAVSVDKVNITIADVDAELELVVRLGHLVDVVNRVFDSLDLNPLLINTLNNVTSLLDDVVGEVEGLLGSITRGDSKLSFLIDNLGNIVQEVAGVAGQTTSTIVGNYLQNMTYTGEQKVLQGGAVQKTYSYSPLNALVDIVFNTAGQIVRAVVQKKGQGGTSTSTSAPTSTPTARR
ncbi:uncharacterized protein J3D65DRAFT_222938 [Phyllosticta citribraziliensis]|uniref:Uncharacterized protein n=1 Tax=Phyllosticta citribraziliensis TaxID=989973 RepID=A0ABR1M4X0_9PEZI